MEDEREAPAEELEAAEDSDNEQQLGDAVGYEPMFTRK